MKDTCKHFIVNNLIKISTVYYSMLTSPDISHVIFSKKKPKNYDSNADVKCQGHLHLTQLMRQPVRCCYGLNICVLP